MARFLLQVQLVRRWLDLPTKVRRDLGSDPMQVATAQQLADALLEMAAGVPNATRI